MKQCCISGNKKLNKIEFVIKKIFINGLTYIAYLKFNYLNQFNKGGNGYQAAKLNFKILNIKL